MAEVGKLDLGLHSVVLFEELAMILNSLRQKKTVRASQLELGAWVQFKKYYTGGGNYDMRRSRMYWSDMEVAEMFKNLRTHLCTESLKGRGGSLPVV